MWAHAIVRDRTRMGAATFGVPNEPSPPDRRLSSENCHTNSNDALTKHRTVIFIKLYILGLNNSFFIRFFFQLTMDVDEASV